MITIDGSYGEGGGAILREAIALSLITKKPFRLINIRKSRPKPGLNYQHLASIELAEKISNSKVINARFGSSEIEFYPGEISAKDVSLDIGSAGSITLAMQSVFLPCLLSGKKFKFTITGGSDVAWSPPADYFKEVFLPAVEQYGKFDFQVQRRGYYPRGQGIISISIQGNQKQNKIKRSFGKTISIKGIINTSKDFFRHHSSEELLEFSKMTFSMPATPTNVSIFSSSSSDEGATFTFYAMIEEEDKSENFIRISCAQIAKDEDELFTEIEKNSIKFKSMLAQKITADEYLADQLIALLGIVGGSIKTNEITEHILSNIYVAELFLDKKFEIDESEKIISIK